MRTAANRQAEEHGQRALPIGSAQLDCRSLSARIQYSAVTEAMEKWSQPHFTNSEVVDSFDVVHLACGAILPKIGERKSCILDRT
jgi:hypothetical protein